MSSETHVLKRVLANAGTLLGGRTVIWGDDTASGTKAQVATALLRQRGDTIDVSAPDVVTIR